MDAVLFSIMCCSEARDLFTLSTLCKETRSIFTGKAFWKARFSLLRLEHEQPSLQVYLQCLKIERKLLSSDWTKFVFYNELNLERLAEMDKSGVDEFRETFEERERLCSELQEARDEGDFATEFCCLRELQSLVNQYLVVQKKDDKYSIFKQREKYDDIGHEISKVSLLEGASKIEALNLLLSLQNS
ncbi:Hypothetical protein BRZCDTV_238 [Brazilian cedratvirus IHUMI]|uniref:F-box domain-containing protein n=1 Tax=Brazilian cedratvirus IHUMI TaxID=2126980 RepID=A0A2R8FE89_9VIRU|nr:Hypothetical protein BRZCDTV_238 [Brazilian cedratvirus IHUMI]